MTPSQAGRVLQRLFEIETYRILALLAFPVAKDLAPFLGERERALSEIANALIGAGEADEAALHGRLTAARRRDREPRGRRTCSASAPPPPTTTWCAAASGELRETRIEGLQTFEEFTERRLAPAVATCAAVARRQEALSERVARVTQLLSTRVEISRERQAFAVLASMDRRAQLQLRLQQTVEGLSVAAITYYVVGLVGYAAKALETAGIPVGPGPRHGHRRAGGGGAGGTRHPAGAARHRPQGGVTTGRFPLGTECQV